LKNILFRNFDLYDTEGVDGPPEHGPGSGFYRNMEKYKGVSDFLNKKKKRNKGKYKAEDSYIENDGTLTKGQERRKNIAARRKLLKSLITKVAIDFPIDDLIGSGPILGDSGIVSDSVPIGGQLDEYLTMPDFEGKLPTELDFGRDYTDEVPATIDHDNKFYQSLDKKIEQLTQKDKLLSPKETEINGLPQGISPLEDLDAPSDEDPDYGITDSGNTLYGKI